MNVKELLHVGSVRFRRIALFAILASSFVSVIVVGIYVVGRLATVRCQIRRAVGLRDAMYMLLLTERNTWDGYLPVLYNGKCGRQGGIDLPKNGISAVYFDNAGTPLGSWRFLAMLWYPYEQPRADWELPWDAEANVDMARFAPDCFCFGSGLDTNVVALTGPESVFEARHEIPFSELPDDVIVLIEVAKSGVHWMAPGDVRVDDLPPRLTDGLDGEGVHVAFADGSVWFIRRDVPLQSLRKFFTVKGARESDRDKVLGQYAVRTLPVGSK